MISPFKCIWNNCESKLDTFCGVFFWEKLTDLFAEVKEKIIWLMMFNSGILRNGRLDDCWMQWKLPSRSSLSAPRCFKMSHWYPPTPQTQRDHPGCVRRWNVSEPSVFRSFFFGGWGLVSFFFFAMQEMVLSGMSHLGDAVEADGHSISGIHRTHYMDPWPWVFYFFVFLFIFRLVFHGVLMLLFFPCLCHITDLNISTEPSGDLRQVLWGETHCLQVPFAKKL